MRTLLTAIVASALMVYAAPRAVAAEAKATTAPMLASSLYEECMAPQTSYYYEYCLSFVEGFGYGFMLATTESINFGATATAACAPQNGTVMTVGDVRMAFVLWVQSHPDKFKILASDAMMAAMIASFPCKAAK